MNRPKRSIEEEVELVFKDAQSRGWRKPKIRRFKNSLWAPKGIRQ